MSQPTSWPFPLPTTVNGPTLRTNLNDGLDALLTLHSGAAEPNDTFAYMPWADTTNDLLKIRNAANSAWIVLGCLTQPFDRWRASRDFDGIAATVGPLPLCCPDGAGFADELIIQSTVATTGSDGSNRYSIQVTNAGANMLAPFVTSTTELVNGMLAIPLTANQVLVANADVRLTITKTGTPTDLSSAQIRATLRGWMGSSDR